ncbi:hypothetical protein ES332_D10G261300v1 [Gossypium tomentosum]|uniref:Uncharacterized protein n=1 Tax=Gossypium tomentosum TaxID=34277 RepID=A0A5D2J9D8_GOSTO|nr:hypothetical protein ES332_D10G261300v1 [Gossypium tomentosum]
MPKLARGSSTFGHLSLEMATSGIPTVERKHPGDRAVSDARGWGASMRRREGHVRRPRAAQGHGQKRAAP